MLPERRRQQIKFTQPSRTKQAFKDECDVNLILSKYQKTQLLNHVNRVQGNYGDFSTAEDYQTSLNKVMAADSAFQDLPASLRQKFNNDPSSFINFISDDKNYDEAINLGLIESSKAQAYLDKKASQALKDSTPSSKSKDTP